MSEQEKGNNIEVERRWTLSNTVAESLAQVLIQKGLSEDAYAQFYLPNMWQDANKSQVSLSLEDSEDSDSQDHMLKFDKAIPHGDLVGHCEVFVPVKEDQLRTLRTMFGVPGEILKRGVDVLGIALEQDVAIRVRMEKTADKIRCVLTFKRKVEGGKSLEVEVPLSMRQFLALKESGNIGLEKTRITAQMEEMSLCLDQLADGQLNFIEIEAGRNKQDVLEGKTPGELLQAFGITTFDCTLEGIQEVTGKKGFSNYSLSQPVKSVFENEDAVAGWLFKLFKGTDSGKE